jgi:hypothetical protein
MHQYMVFALARLEDPIQDTHQCFVNPAIQLTVEIAVVFFGRVLHNNTAHLNAKYVNLSLFENEPPLTAVPASATIATGSSRSSRRSSTVETNFS